MMRQPEAIEAPAVTQETGMVEKQRPMVQTRSHKVQRKMQAMPGCPESPEHLRPPLEGSEKSTRLEDI